MNGILSGLINRYQEILERHRNLPFLRATMAACALVAVADGRISFPERVRIDQILQTLEALRVFDPHEGVNQFNDFVDAIRESPKAGREKAIEAVRTVADDRDTAALMLRICLAVSEANGEKGLADQIEIVSLCSLLGIEPTDCGLYTDDSPEDILNVGSGGDSPARPA